MRLQPIIMQGDISIPKILEYYMGKNTPARQEFIIENLVVETNIEESLV
jgi:topoisomerase-4 subunit B